MERIYIYIYIYDFSDFLTAGNNEKKKYIYKEKRKKKNFGAENLIGLLPRLYCEKKPGVSHWIYKLQLEIWRGTLLL